MEPSDSSAFWTELATRHQQDLSEFGFETIKRRQALKYFNWQWTMRGIRRSEQLRFLIKQSSIFDISRAIIGPHTLQAKEWPEVPWNFFDRWFYSFAVWLLWNYASSVDKYELSHFLEPDLGRPFPVFYRKRLISQDLGNSILETNSMIEALTGHETPNSILEIGAGYGRNAYLLMQHWPNAIYTILDIEPALSVSKWYLGNLFPGRKINFIDAASDNVEELLKKRQYDLALSISSLQELSLIKIRKYMALLNSCVNHHGVVYLKQWLDWFNPIDNIRVKFTADYSIPKNWEEIFFRRARVQTNFGEAAWKKV